MTHAALAAENKNELHQQVADVALENILQTVLALLGVHDWALQKMTKRRVGANQFAQLVKLLANFGGNIRARGQSQREQTLCIHFRDSIHLCGHLIPVE